MQRDFIEPSAFGAALGNDVTRLAQAWSPRRACSPGRVLGTMVVHTRESHVPDPSDCPRAKRCRGEPCLRIGDHGPTGRVLVRGEPGNAIIPVLQPEPNKTAIDKPGKGAFDATPLQHSLDQRGITHLIFGGVTTELCVQTRMREANDRGCDSLLVEAATASQFPRFKRAALEMITAQGGIVGWTCKLEALLLA